MDIGIQTVGGQTAQQIHFVCIGNRNNQVSIFNTGTSQNLHGGAVAAHTHGIKGFHRGIEHGALFIDQSQIMTLCRQLLGQGPTDLAYTGNNNIHYKPPDS